MSKKYIFKRPSFWLAIEIQKKAKEIVEKNKGKKPLTKTEPVAFGLNAVILNFALDESLSIDNIENPLRKIKGVGYILLRVARLPLFLSLVLGKRPSCDRTWDNLQQNTLSQVYSSH